MIGDVLPVEMERIATEIVDACFKVHMELGPGLLESVYVTCLAYELQKRGLRVEREVVIPIVYDGVQLDSSLRIDLLVENAVIIEIKAVEKMNPVFESQMLTYLKLTNRRLGFLVNFNVPVIRNGIKRMIR
jgi:GxxExxY protein